MLAASLSQAGKPKRDIRGRPFDLSYVWRLIFEPVVQLGHALHPRLVLQ